MKKPILSTIASLVISCVVMAQKDTTSPVLQQAADRNSCSDFLKIEKEINEMVVAISTDYSADATFLSKFRHDQVEWKAYRTAQIDMIFPNTDKSVYGPSYPTCRCNWLVEMDNARKDFLLNWMQYNSNQNTCGGSINSKKRKSYVKFNE